MVRLTAKDGTIADFNLSAAAEYKVRCAWKVFKDDPLYAHKQFVFIPKGSTKEFHRIWQVGEIADIEILQEVQQESAVEQGAL